MPASNGHGCPVAANNTLRTGLGNGNEVRRGIIHAEGVWFWAGGASDIIRAAGGSLPSNATGSFLPSTEGRDVGDVDIVVNNAGYFPNRSIDELDLPTWRKTMATNLDPQFLSAKYFLPAMRKKKWGRFIGISSNMVGLGIPGMSHYIATKMGIMGFMRGLANDVATDGITANAVLPGLTNTLATAPQSEEQKRATWEQQAIKRLAEPEDIAGAILFLTSDDAAFITGQAIVVDGGQYRIG